MTEASRILANPHVRTVLPDGALLVQPLRFIPIAAPVGDPPAVAIPAAAGRGEGV